MSYNLILSRDTIKIGWHLELQISHLFSRLHLMHYFMRVPLVYIFTKKSYSHN